MWGLPNGNNLGTETAKNAEIYQWNLGMQQAFQGNIVIGINYSANRSTHLPWGGYNSTSNRNFIASDVRRQQTSESLSGLVDNPFQGMFAGPNAVINQPESRYGDDQLPLLNLLASCIRNSTARSKGFPKLAASSWYNALQVVFQKRQGKYLNFEGKYTWSKNTDNSSTGFNAFVGTLNNGNPQELDNLKAEWSVSANDATNRFVAAVVWKLPVGRWRSDRRKYEPGPRCSRGWMAIDDVDHFPDRPTAGSYHERRAHRGRQPTPGRDLRERQFPHHQASAFTMRAATAHHG